MQFSGDNGNFRIGAEETHTFYSIPSRNTKSPILIQPSSTFYQEIRLLMLIFKVLGVFPYNVTETGNMYVKLLSLYVLYSLVLVTALIVSATFVVIERINLETPNTSITLEYALRLFASSIFLVPLTQWPETYKKVQFFNKWNEFQRQYTETTGKPLCLKLRRKIIASLLLVMLVTSFFSVHIMLNGICLQWWHIFVYIYAYSMATSMPVVWLLSCTAILKITEILSNEMNHHFSNRLHVRSEHINRYRKLWLRISELTEDLGNSMGFTHGAQILLFFTLSVLMSYHVLISLEEYYDWSLFLGVLLFHCIIFTGCNAAQNVTEQVNKKFVLHLESLMEKIQPNNNTGLYEMQKFLSTIARCPANISLCGFVVINRGLVTSLVSAMVTYLIVLVQLDE